MNEMVSADRERVAVARDHPDLQIGIGHFDAGGEPSRAPVKRWEAVGVHVVWEAAETADTGDEHDLFLRNAEFRHYLLNLRQDRIVAAAGTPAHFLIGLEIFASEFDRSVCCMSVFAH